MKDVKNREEIKKKAEEELKKVFEQRKRKSEIDTYPKIKPSQTKRREQYKESKSSITV